MELVFNGMGMVFLRAEALGAEQPIGADASVRERDEGDCMECPGKGRRGGAMASRGRKEGGGMVAAVLLFSAALSKVQNSTGASDPIGSFFTYGTMGGMGLSRQNRDKYWKGWCRARKKEKTTQQKKYNCPHRSKKVRKVNKRPAQGFALCRRESDVYHGRHKIPNDAFAIIGRSLHRLLPMAMPCADCLMPLRGVIA